jgi:hypothetical protein
MSKFSPNLTLIIFGLFGLAIPSIAAADIPAINPCPGIYYEEPHNSTRIVPMGCLPNAATQMLRDQQSTPSAIPTSFDNQQTSITRVTPSQGLISIRLRNNMGTMVTYQAIGETSPRSLEGGQEILLRNLPVPITMTLQRSDGGLVRLMPMVSNQEGVLGVSVNAATGLNDSQLTLGIQSQGEVYAY